MPRYVNIAAEAPLIPAGITGEQAEAIRDADAVATLSVAAAGHGPHRGFTVDLATGSIECYCGDLIRPLPVGPPGTGTPA